MKDYSYSLQKKIYITLYWCQLCNYFFFSEIACLPSYQHNEPKKAFYCIYIHVVKRIDHDSKFNWINKFQELDSYLTKFHKIIQVWYDSQKTKKNTPRNVCALTWTTHIILANFILLGFRNCIHIKTLAPSVKGRGNMQII